MQNAQTTLVRFFSRGPGQMRATQRWVPPRNVRRTATVWYFFSDTMFRAGRAHTEDE
jgi:hypothetical protein